MNIKSIPIKIKEWLFLDTWAIPVDIFRILSGILLFSYFLNLLLEVEDFSSLNGLIDHDYFLEHFKSLKINFFQSGSNENIFRVLTIVGCFGSLGLFLGIRTRIISAALYIIAVSIQRWNFAVIYVDDITIHLLLFWLILLPTGSTLLIHDLFRHGKSSFKKWSGIKVPGVAVNCFLLNVCWIYFFAGITKVVVDYWQDGFALYPILLLSISRVRDLINPDIFPFLKVATYIVLVIEISLPLFLLSPRGSITKWLGLALQIFFHVGIIATLRIPYANIALIASAVLFYREELMHLIHKIIRFNHNVDIKKGLKIVSVTSIVYLILVTVSVCRFIPYVDKVAWPATYVLWSVGTVQQYHLFDWIYRFNFHKQQTIEFRKHGERNPFKLPHSNEIIPDTVRHSLTELRLYDVRWVLFIPPKNRAEFKKDLKLRIAQRACRRINDNGHFRITTTLHRVTPDNISLNKKPAVYEDSFYCYYDEVSALKSRRIK